MHFCHTTSLNIFSLIFSPFWRESFCGSRWKMLRPYTKVFFPLPTQIHFLSKVFHPSYFIFKQTHSKSIITFHINLKEAQCNFPLMITIRISKTDIVIHQNLFLVTPLFYNCKIYSKDDYSFKWCKNYDSWKAFNVISNLIWKDSQ